MGYNKKTWKNRSSAYPTRRRLSVISQSNNDMVVEVAREEGTISEAGDVFSASSMNDLEDRIKAGFDAVDSTLDSASNNPIKNSALTDTIDNAIIHVETEDTSSRYYVEGSTLIWKETRYEALTDIEIGDTFVVNTNIGVASSNMQGEINVATIRATQALKALSYTEKTSDAFDPTKGYSLGELCIKNDHVYECIDPYTTGAPWDSVASKFQHTSLTSKANSLNSALNDNTLITTGTPTWNVSTQGGYFSNISLPSSYDEAKFIIIQLNTWTADYNFFYYTAKKGADGHWKSGVYCSGQASLRYIGVFN